MLNMDLDKEIQPNYTDCWEGTRKQECMSVVCQYLLYLFIFKCLKPHPLGMYINIKKDDLSKHNLSIMIKPSKRQILDPLQDCLEDKRSLRLS